MTLEQLKERIEATCNKNGIFPTEIDVEKVDEEWENDDIFCYVRLDGKILSCFSPTTDLLLEKIDLMCREIKARQSSATNGIDV